MCGYGKYSGEAMEDDIGHVVDLQRVEEEALMDKNHQLLHECKTNDDWAEGMDLEKATLRLYFKMRSLSRQLPPHNCFLSVV